MWSRQTIALYETVLEARRGAGGGPGDGPSYGEAPRQGLDTPPLSGRPPVLGLVIARQSAAALAAAASAGGGRNVSTNKPARAVAGRRYYGIAGLTVQVESDLPITDTTFEPKFAVFEVEGPGPDTIVVQHHFGLPSFDEADLGRELYRRPPWAIYRSTDRITYIMGGPEPRAAPVCRLGDSDHTSIEVLTASSARSTSARAA